MNSFSIRVKYRPLRIGWCIKNEDFESLREVVKLSHIFCGGRYNPIIPVGNDISEKLIKLFRVDLLIPVRNDKEITEFINKFQNLPNPLWDYSLFTTGINGEKYPRILDISHSLSLLYEKNFKNNPEPKFKFTFYEWNDDDPLSDIFLLTFGSFPSYEETGKDYSETIRKLLKYNILSLSKDTLPNNFFLSYTPNGLTMYRLKQYYLPLDHFSSPGFFIGDSTSFNDLVSYWNLRATNKDVFFYDQNFKEQLFEFRDNLVEYLSSKIIEPNSLRNNIQLWMSHEIDISGFGKYTSPHAISSVSWNGLHIQVPIMHFDEQSVLANFEKTNSKSNLSFLLPHKPFTETISNRQFLVASVNLESSYLHDTNQTFIIPNFPELNEYLGRNLYFRYDRIRVEPGGIGIIIESFEDHIQLHALNTSSLISKIFESVGITSDHSNAGLVNNRLIQQMGDLQGCRVFKIRGVRELIGKYTPDKSFTRSEALCLIGGIDPQVGKLNFSDYEGLYLEPRKGGTKLKPEDAFIYLLKNKVFRVGLELHCPFCELDFWIALDDARSLTTCELCGNEFIITPQLKDRDWRYRRSGIFGRDDNQLGGIPVALTLQQLDTVLHWGTLFSTALKLTSSDNTINCESDFILLYQTPREYKLQIAISECKNQNEISNNDVLNLLSVAKKLEEKGIETFIIFSKLCDFTQEELERFKKINDRYHIRLILLTQRELEPYFIYEKTSREFDVQQTAICFEDMVQTTNDVFYEKRKKGPTKSLLPPTF